MGIYDRPYYRDEPPPGMGLTWQSRSPVSVIIVTCSVLFLVTAIIGQRSFDLLDFLALHSSDVTRPWYWWRFLTYGFVHDTGGIGHVLFNMLTLYFLGRTVEQRYGYAEFWRIYLSSVVLCGVGWGILHWFAGDPTAVIGASGAVLTIAMLFVLNYPFSTLMIWGILPVPAWLVGLFMVLGNLSVSPSSGIAHDVHLFGLAYAAVYFYGRLDLSRLTGWAAGLKLPKRGRPRLKTFNPDAAHDGTDAKDAAEADRILDKIHTSGQESLSRKERKFLENYSQRMRRQKR